MYLGIIPCLSLAIARLTSAQREHFAIWVIKAPYSSGYAHRDCLWQQDLTQKWSAWQEMFSLQSQLHLPILPTDPQNISPDFTFDSDNGESYSGQLMQELGVSLWQWIFSDTISNSLAQSQGIAIGKNQPLRLRLDIRDPHLIPLPWEISQPEKAKPSISLNEQILFSRTSCDVAPLHRLSTQEGLNILLVLGTDIAESELLGEEKIYLETLPDEQPNFPVSNRAIELQREATTLAEIIKKSSLSWRDRNTILPNVPTQVDTLIQPTPAELIEALETGIYNVFFYADHGIPAPDGGLLFLQPYTTINGTELAQVLVRNQVILSVFNACWGAQPDLQEQQAVERSSLAEVLIHHGVPAVLAMRDSIADQEALTFIEAFTKAICGRMPIDKAVAVARQKLLTVYKFNQPAWTLPILYMHPEFNGEMINPIDDRDRDRDRTVLPRFNQANLPVAYLRCLDNSDKWQVHGGIMRVGRGQENDLVIKEKWVSQKHAEILCRENDWQLSQENSYFLKDFSRFGTLINVDGIWKKIHHQEIPLQSGVQIKFGSSHGQILEFFIEGQ